MAQFAVVVVYSSRGMTIAEGDDYGEMNREFDKAVARGETVVLLDRHAVIGTRPMVKRSWGQYERR